MNKIFVFIFILISFARISSSAEITVPNDGLLLIISDNTPPLEMKAIRLFSQRFKERSNHNAKIITSSKYLSDIGTNNRYLPIFMGAGKSNSSMTDIMTNNGFTVPMSDESYFIHFSDVNDESKSRYLSEYGLVCGKDANGLLYGLGNILRLFEYRRSISIKPISKTVSPAVGDRGVYLAMHFHNYYEDASINKIERYIEDCALFGFNKVYTLFGIGGYPESAIKDKKSYISKMVLRIRRINSIARKLGMKTGFIGEANEGWIFYPELKAVKSPNPTRPYGIICPSRQGGLDLILRYRKTILEMIGPIDEYCIWPYDSGGCGCDLCSDENGWTKTYLKIAPEIAKTVKKKNPNASIIISTWQMTHPERLMVYDLINAKTSWFDGVMMQAEYVDEILIPDNYSRLIFPEISMFGCYFTSYGCNGANPAAVKFVEQAKKAVDLKFGAVIYSEGIYEDFNKFVWASVMREPYMSAYDIVKEYAGYYLGTDNSEKGAELILGLEDIWGSAKLGNSDLNKVSKLYEIASSIEPSVPANDWCADRYMLLYYRINMDLLMKKIGPDTINHQKANKIYYMLRNHDIDPDLRDSINDLNVVLNDRKKFMHDLFETYWDYLSYFMITDIMLVFRPDELTGNVNYESLLDASANALKAKNDNDMRKIMLEGYQKFYWMNNVSYSMF